jgi:hypothetical protein
MRRDAAPPGFVVVPALEDFERGEDRLLAGYWTGQREARSVAESRSIAVACHAMTTTPPPAPPE